MRAFRRLFLRRFFRERGLLRALAGETRIAAAIERELAAIHVQRVIRHLVEEIAIMRNHDKRVRVALQMLSEPERAFDIEIVRGLVEQQQIRLPEEHRRERHAHAPATGKLGTGAADILGRKTEAGENGRRPRRSGFRANIRESQLDIRDAVRIGGGFRLFQQSKALGIRRENRVEQCVRPARRFLRDMAEDRLARHGDRAAFERDLAKDELEQRGFSAAIAADQPRTRRRG